MALNFQVFFIANGQFNFFKLRRNLLRLEFVGQNFFSEISSGFDSVNLQIFVVAGLFHEKVAAVAEPVDDIENEKQERHGDEKKSVHMDVVLSTDALIPSQFHLTQCLIIRTVFGTLEIQ